MSKQLINLFKHNPFSLSVIFDHPGEFEWTLQGFGMLRTYLSKTLRLHVWHSEYAVPDVSLVHTHPWDFESLVVCGRILNTRFEQVAEDEGIPYQYSTIKCGAGGGMRSDPVPCGLLSHGIEEICAGEIYQQKANEIHFSNPDDGTITLVDRTFHADTEHAKVFWPAGQEWVSAEPRPATSREVENILTAAWSKFREDHKSSCRCA